MNQPQPLVLSSSVHFPNFFSPYFEEADGTDSVVGEANKIKARSLSEPGLLLQSSRCLYCSFTMSPLRMYSFPARLLKHLHATAYAAVIMVNSEHPSVEP